MGSSNPNFEDFPYPDPTRPLFPLNSNLETFVSSAEYILDNGNSSNELNIQNEVQPEFTFSTQPKNNEFIQNDAICSFMASSLSYHQGDILTKFASSSQLSLSQESDYSIDEGSHLVSRHDESSIGEYDDIMYTSSQLLSQKGPSYQENLQTNFFPTQPLGQGSDMFIYQSNILTNLTSNGPQSLSQGYDVSYHNLWNNFTSTSPQPFSQGSNILCQQSRLLGNFDSTHPQPLNQWSSPLYELSTHLENFSSKPPQALSQGSNPAYHNRSTLLGNFASNPPQLLNQGSNPSYHHRSNFLSNFSSNPLQPSNQRPNLQYNQRNLLPNNFAPLSQTLSQRVSDPSYHQGNPLASFSSTLPPLTQAPNQSYQQNNPSTNFTFTPQPLNQGSSSLVPLMNYGFNNQNDQNISGSPSFSNERDDYSSTLLINQIRQKCKGSKNGDQVGTPLVPYNYNTTIVPQIPQNNQVFNLPPLHMPVSLVFPQINIDNSNNNYQMMLNNNMIAPNNGTVPISTASPRQTSARTNRGRRTKNNRTSLATLNPDSQLIFGKGLLRHYQILINNSMSRGINYGQGDNPYMGSASRGKRRE